MVCNFLKIHRTKNRQNTSWCSEGCLLTASNSEFDRHPFTINERRCDLHWVHWVLPSATHAAAASHGTTRALWVVSYTLVWFSSEHFQMKTQLVGLAHFRSFLSLGCNKRPGRSSFNKYKLESWLTNHKCQFAKIDGRLHRTFFLENMDKEF